MFWPLSLTSNRSVDGVKATDEVMIEVYEEDEVVMLLLVVTDLLFLETCEKEQFDVPIW